MNIDIGALVPIVVAIFASTGFWSFIQNKSSKKSNQSSLLIGLAHDRILDLGNRYIKRGYITMQEYTNIYNYLYIPYHLEGGNGSGDRIITEVSKLPIREYIKEEEEY